MKPESPDSAEPVALVSVIAGASTAMLVPEKCAAGSNDSEPEESKVSAAPPLMVAPASTVSAPIVVVGRSLRVMSTWPALETRSKAPSPLTLPLPPPMVMG